MPIFNMFPQRIQSQSLLETQPSYSHKPEKIQPTTTKTLNPWFPYSPKLSFVCKITPQEYFAAKTGDFNIEFLFTQVMTSWILKIYLWSSSKTMADR